MKILSILSVISISVFFIVYANFDPCPGYDTCSDFAEGIKTGEADPLTASNLISYLPTVDGKTRLIIVQAKARAASNMPIND